MERLSMHRAFFLALLLGSVGTPTFAQEVPERRNFPPVPSVPGGIADEIVPGRLLVGHRPGADLAADRAALRIETAGGRWAGHQSGINVSVLEVDPSRQEDLRRSLEQSGRFSFVEPDYVAHALATPNDPSYPQQWHLPIIQAPIAWNSATGNLSVSIAMIDSGVDPSHPDLAAHLVPGWSFLTGTSNTRDVLGHGTQTAGTAAAIGNNAVGVTGVAWNVSITPLVVLDSTNFASYSNIASAIQYAADHGVRVANISIGGTSPSATLQSAVNYAWNKGTVVIAAAGNYGTSAPIYPGACTNVLAVTATDNTDTITSWSSYGTWVSLAAPGLNIVTTAMGGGYGAASGTSFSAPIVAGVAALVLSVNPSLTASQIASVLEMSADDLGPAGWDQAYGWGRVNAARAVSLAKGNTFITLGTPPPTDTIPPAVTILSPANGAVVWGGNLQIAASATDNVGVTRMALYVNGAQYASCASRSCSTSVNPRKLPSPITIAALAWDAAGNAGSASVTITVSH
jgi:thermitase